MKNFILATVASVVLLAVPKANAQQYAPSSNFTPFTKQRETPTWEQPTAAHPRDREVYPQQAAPMKQKFDVSPTVGPAQEY